jgi:hypothetical protein
MKHQASLRVSKKMAEAILWDAVGTTDRGRPTDLYEDIATGELVVVFEYDDRRPEQVQNILLSPEELAYRVAVGYDAPEHLREDSVSIGGTD